jgi:hypothetical protein
MPFLYPSCCLTPFPSPLPINSPTLLNGPLVFLILLLQSTVRDDPLIVLFLIVYSLWILNRCRDDLTSASSSLAAAAAAAAAGGGGGVGVSDTYKAAPVSGVAVGTTQLLLAGGWRGCV